MMKVYTILVAATMLVTIIISPLVPTEPEVADSAIIVKGEEEPSDTVMTAAPVPTDPPTPHYSTDAELSRDQIRRIVERSNETTTPDVTPRKTKLAT